MTPRSCAEAITATDVTFAYPPLPHTVSTDALRGVTLRVADGEGAAVMGASGSGKSTLCYVLAGLAPRYTGGKLRGEVRLHGHDVGASEPPVGAVGVLFQDAATQLFNTTAEDEVAWGLEALALPPEEIETRVTAALRQFGLEALRQRPPWALSGGQQKRLALAAVWAMRPRILLLDEPLGGLDPAGRAEVLNALSQLRQEGTTLLFTTRRPSVARMTDRTLVLEAGAVSQAMATRELLLQEDHLTRAGILYPPRLWPRLEGPPPVEAPPYAVEITGLRYRYAEGPEVLHGLDLTVRRGEFVALVGVNGAGKTTLARHLNGLLHPTAGRVRVMGLETTAHPVGVLARQVGLLFQRPEQQLFAATVRDEVAYGPRRLGLEDVEGRVARALARFGLEPYADRPPALLGYGTQRAVTLAILAALDPPILVLDEPMVGLDGRGWAQCLDWLAERRAAGTTIIIATHEMALAARAERVIALEAGRIAHDGPPHVVLPRVEAEAVA